MATAAAPTRPAPRDAGVRYVELDGPLSLDLDTPDDLLLVELLVDDPDRGARDGRCRLMPGSLPDGRLEVVALDGIPEVIPGDDLVAFLGDAIQRSPGALPLHEGDVLVVTQKVVSKPRARSST